VSHETATEGYNADCTGKFLRGISGKCRAESYDFVCFRSCCTCHTSLRNWQALL